MMRLLVKKQTKMMNGKHNIYMQKEKTGAKKKIGNKLHTCVMLPTGDPRYTKCFYCPRIDIVHENRTK